MGKGRADLKLFLNCATTVVALALVYFGIRFVLSSNRTAMYPAYHWNVTGKVFDENTNSLHGVRVTADGNVRVTLINHIAGTHIKTFHQETITDKSGNFALAFEACSFELSFRNIGYVGQITNFLHYSNYLGQDTQQTLKVFLKKQAP